MIRKFALMILLTAGFFWTVTIILRQHESIHGMLDSWLPRDVVDGFVLAAFAFWALSGSGGSKDAERRDSNQP